MKEITAVELYDPKELANLLAKKTLDQKINILQQINYFNLYATKQDVKNWQAARLVAIDYLVPDWTEYIRVLDDVMIDGHISGIIQTIKDKIQAKEFEIVNAAGEPDEDKIKDLFDQEWFYRFMEFFIESLFYPFSLVQLGNLNQFNRFDEMELIPRENVIPQFNWIKKYSYITTIDKTAGWAWNSPELDNYFIFMSSRIIPGNNKLSVHHLGMLDKAAYHGLGKKHMLTYWWRYGEMYGLPFRHGQTDIRDNIRRKNLEDTFKNAGNNQWVITDKEDTIMLVESKQTGSRNIFLELMNYSNQEISEAFIGNKSVTDEKSFVGSAEVGERIFEERQKSILRKFKNIVNNALIPRMIFYGLPVEGYWMRWRNEDKVTYDQRLKAIGAIKDLVEFDVDELSDLLGFKLTKKEVQTGLNQIQQGSTSVIPAVKALYEHYLNQ
jgi:hypothetical protein